MKRRQSWPRFVCTLSLVMVAIVSPCRGETPADAKSAAELMRQRTARLSRITVAVRKFETERHYFPKRVLRSEAGKPLLSWRVALLPYLGLEDLHEQFHLDEPWDSEHNRELIRRMPDVFDVGVYAEGEEDAAAGYTHVVVPMMEGSLWDGLRDNELCVYDVQDGCAYTLATFAAPPESAVVWTKPEDLSLSPENIGGDLFGQREECLITTFDGAVLRIAKSTSNEDLNALITFDGDDTVDWDNFMPWRKARKAKATPTPAPQPRNRDWSLGIPDHATDTILEKILRKKPSVTRLSLGRTQVTDAGLIHLNGLTSLKHVSLNEHQATDLGLEHLKEVASLESLNLSDMPVTDVGLKHLATLTKLKSLNLMRTKTTDAGLSNIRGLTRLEDLSLSDTPMTDAGLEHLQKLTNLKRLRLLGTAVTGTGLVHLRGLKQLELLILTRTEVRSTELRHLQGMNKLTRLYLTATRVDDAGLGYLRSLQSLKTLNLDLTHVTDAGLEQLKGFQNLRSLNLQYTQVTDAGVKDLKTGLPKRCWVLTGSLLDPLDGINSSFSFTKPVGGSVRDGKWKLYAHARQNESIALYDLLTDPRERNNVADVHPEVVMRLLRRLRDLLETSAPSDATSEWLRYHGAD